MTNTVITRRYSVEFFEYVEKILLNWFWKIVWVALILSLFISVYLNFSIRVSTVKLNSVREEHQLLIMQRDRLMLEIEGLQMRRHTERKATKLHDYRFVGKSKVKHIVIN